MQHVVRVALRDADVGGLQAGAHPGDGAVVVGALDVDHLLEAAFPFGDVIRHIGHKVGVAAVALAHDPIFVVAILGGLEPEGAVMFVGLASVVQFLHDIVDLAAQVQAGLQVIVVKLDGKRLQVQVLLMAQVRHGEQADVIEFLDVARRGELAVVRAHRFLFQEVLGNVGNVVAVVSQFRPLRVARLEALGAQLGAGGQRADLHASVVVIELAVHLPALGLEQVANGVAQRRLAAVANVQRARWISGNKLHQHAVTGVGLLAKRRGLRQHLAHDLLLGLGLEFDIDKAGTGNVNGRHPALKRRGRQQLGAQVFGQLTRVELERLGQLHGGGGGQVTMGGDLGRLKSGFGTRAGKEFFQGLRQGFEQFNFYRQHAADFTRDSGPVRFPQR